MHYQDTYHGGFTETNLILYMVMVFSLNLVKTREIWLRTKLK